MLVKKMLCDAVIALMQKLSNLQDEVDAYDLEMEIAQDVHNLHGLCEGFYTDRLLAVIREFPDEFEPDYRLANYYFLVSNNKELAKIHANSALQKIDVNDPEMQPWLSELHRITKLV